MDNELRLIQYLYGEEEHPEEVERLLTADAALQAEYRRMKATKERLDARRPQRPERATLEGIVAAAAPRHTPAAPRRDREPIARVQGVRRRVLGLTSALAVLLVAVSVGVWQWDADRLLDSPSSEAVVDAQSATEPRQMAASGAAEEEALPAWNEADDELIRLHHYIETLQGRSSPERWDSPAAGFQPASQTRSVGR